MIIRCLLQPNVQCLVTKTKCKQPSQDCTERNKIKKKEKKKTRTRDDRLCDAQETQFIKTLLLRETN